MSEHRIVMLATKYAPGDDHQPLTDAYPSLMGGLAKLTFQSKRLSIVTLVVAGHQRQ